MEKNKMKTVYILTEEGREYTKAGCDYIADMVKNIVKDDSDLVFAMGAMYNEAKYLIMALEEHPDAYIAVSTAENVELIWLLSFKTLHK